MFIDSGCNYIYNKNKIFRKLNETQKTNVNVMITNKCGWKKKNYCIKISHDKVKILQNIQHVPSLAHNLLSVGQLMASGIQFYLMIKNVY